MPSHTNWTFMPTFLMEQIARRKHSSRVDSFNVIDYVKQNQIFKIWSLKLKIKWIVRKHEEKFIKITNRIKVFFFSTLI